MNSEQLKALQAPIKEKYAANPDAAIITLSAQATIGENISCKVATGKAWVEAGLHPATGGTGLLACSGDMLLEALAACAGVTLKAVATAMGIDLQTGTVKAEGDLDFRGTLGVSKEVPVGFKEIRLQFELGKHILPDQVATLKKLTERYCVVYQTLVNSVTVTTSFD